MEKRDAGEVVPAREQTQVMISAHLVAAPGRNGKAGHEEDDLHATPSHCLVVAAWRQMPAVAPRRQRHHATACAALRSPR